MTELSVTIESIKTLKLNRNEVLVFQLGEDVNMESLLKFKKMVNKALPKFKDRFLFLAGDIELTKVAVQ